MPERGKTPGLMEISAKNETLLRKYLLGDASEQEQKEVELWLMSEEEAYYLLEAAEDDLIDESLAGRLKGRALDRFNNHFLAAPERQRKLQFSRSFKRAVKAATPPIHVQPPSPDPSFWPRLLDTLRYRPSVAYAGSALIIIIMLIGNARSLLRVAELQEQLRSATEQIADAGRDRDGLKRQLDESQAAAARALEAQRALEASVAAGKIPSGPTRLLLTLMPGAVRSPGTVPTMPQVPLTPNSSLVEFSLALLNDNFTAYRVSLVNAERREILSYNALAASTTAQGKTVVVAVPAQILSDADYSLILSGILDTGAPETVDRYDFRAVRQ